MSEDVGELAQKAWARLEDARKQAGIKEPTLKLASIGILMHVFEGARRRRELEARVEALERQQKAMRYRGVWQPAEAYEKGNLATYDGSLWIAIDENPGKPGASGWQLAAKRGRDGKDA